jgi:hypothetical protein
MDIRRGLIQAVQASALISRGSRGNSLAKRRSTMFVYRMANYFRASYSNQAGVAVFSKSASWNRAMFGVNEFLFDISVLQCASTRSVIHSTSLTFVRSATWLVESEFERSSRALLHDLSKLKIGKSERKLLIASEFNNSSGQLNMLAQAANGIDGILHLALMPSPLQWQSNTNRFDSYRFDGTTWLPDSLAVC